MFPIWAVFKKEVRAYFDAPIAYIFMIIFLVINSWLFFRSFFILGEATIRPFFNIMPWVLLFFIPAISMRLWAE